VAQAWLVTFGWHSDAPLLLIGWRGGAGRKIALAAAGLCFSESRAHIINLIIINPLISKFNYDYYLIIKS
jgi:hypothetical protein